MLSVEHCKKTLKNNKELNEEQVKSIRDELYVLAGVAFDQWKQSFSSTKGEVESSLAGEKPRLSHSCGIETK
ncbi:MAG: hypothetical protein WC446_02675 [Candidatus Paceibacterota bacterium]|jgi:hypothetical protein